MKKILYLLAALTAGGAVADAQVLQPEAGKYYRVKHASGLYLSDVAFHAQIKNKVEDNSQIVQFIPVAGSSDTYNIMRVRRSQFYGSDKKWSSTIISRDHALARFKIVPAADGYVTLQNVGNGNKSFGTDDTKDGSNVYTDKDGKNASLHYWMIEEAEKYDESALELPDKYPGQDVAYGDPRRDVYPGYKLVFAEEFSDYGKPNSDVWNYETGYKRNNEDQYYNGDKNCYQQDGVLVIEARDVKSNPIKDGSKTYNWTSGSMTSKGSWNKGFNWKFGIYEVRARIPQRDGCWPAIWSTGRQYEWPYGGEIDIMEYYKKAIHGNVCWGNSVRYGGTWNSATVSDSELGSGFGDEYHIWRMFWDYEHIELWCDDFLVNNIDLDTTKNEDCTSGWEASKADDGNGCNPFREVRQMMWLNLALGGNNGGNPSAPPYPCRFLVDYARVYQKVGTDGNGTYHVDPVVSEPMFIYKDGEENSGPTSFVDSFPAEEIEVAPAEFYNLQGMRIENPKQGDLVIRRSGNKATKVLVR